MIKYLLKITPMLFILTSCTKPVSVDNLNAEEGVAIDPETNQPYSGEAFLNFYDGSKRTIGNYENGIKTGDWTYYIKGNEDNFYILSFVDGEIVSANYNEGDRRWVGTPVEHSPDSMMANGQYFVQEVEVYNFSMSPKVYVQLIQNLTNGNLTRWWENNQMHSDGNFKDGNRNGPFTFWYKSGVKKETSTWRNGEQIGTTTQFWENGNKYAEAQYLKGNHSGKLVWWYEDGQKKEEANFINGLRDGLAYWWYPNGNKKGFADISSGMGKITMFAIDDTYSKQYEVKGDQIFCSSGEILFSVEKVSNDIVLPIGDGTCDCADCSDENNN